MSESNLAMAHIPYGYIISEGKAQIDPGCAEKLMQFFKNYLGGLSIEDAGCDIPLGRTSLGKMLKNPVYLGDDYYPQIIDAEIFEAAQAERLRRYDARGRPSTATPLDTVPIQTSFRMKKFKEKYDDPKKQAEYVYKQIKDV
ncbi:MAG: recombinase [Aeriscardovia sp.]|nr:recombinase [Aeriscardovia sp.]